MCKKYDTGEDFVEVEEAVELSAFATVGEMEKARSIAQRYIELREREGSPLCSPFILGTVFHAGFIAGKRAAKAEKKQR